MRLNILFESKISSKWALGLLIITSGWVWNDLGSLGKSMTIETNLYLEYNSIANKMYRLL